MAELVDALVSNTSELTLVPVRPRLRVQKALERGLFCFYSNSLCEISVFFRIFEQSLPKRMTNHLHPYKSKQNQFDRRYLEMARIWAQNSYCKRRKVGALIVKDKMIISDGYNGTPSGFENICEDENNKTKPYVLHAEANAITKVAKSNNCSQEATLYVTTSPCLECSKLIIQSGIKRVVYCESYHTLDGIDLLKRAGVEVIFIDLDKDRIDQIMQKNA
jgi:dCMP deaminase